MRAGLFQSIKDGVMAHPGENMGPEEAIEQMTRHALDIAPAKAPLSSLWGWHPLSG